MNENHFISSQLTLAMFELGVAVVSAPVVTFGALYYFRRVRMDRPAIGRFNGRDIAFLLVFLMILPGFYLLLPRWLLECFLVLTFMGALSIGFQPVLNRTVLWLGIGTLIGADLWFGQHLLGSVIGWQVMWAENSLLVLLAAISVSNLYVQGGMQLRHIAWFAGALAIYDSVFTLGFPVTNLLIRDFVGYPLFPATGMRIYYNEATLGLGDLLVFAAFTLAAYKAYGKPALRLATVLIIIFGVALPATSGLIINFIDSRHDVIIPAQTFFGPAALLAYFWLRRRYGRERSMKEFLASPDAARPGRATAPVIETPELPVTTPTESPLPTSTG